MGTTDATLVAQAVTKRFGSVLALDRVVLQIGPGERLAIIGPNGAGKSTLLNVVSGLVRHDEGRIYLDGVEVSSLSPARRARLGLGRLFQIPSVFAGLSVEDNLWLAAEGARRWGRAGDAAFTHSARTRVAELLEVCGLEDMRERPAAALPYGKLRRLELGLALAGRPRILLLDEPTAGLSEEETEGLLELIRGLGRSVTVVAVEHNLGFALRLADRVAVLHEGRVIWEGPPGQVMTAPNVVRVYFGR